MYFAGMTGFTTVSMTASRSSSVEISGLCWVETTMAGQRRTLPSLSYSTVTWLLPSGRSQLSSPLLRTAASRRHRAWAMAMGAGISSGVSSQA